MRKLYFNVEIQRQESLSFQGTDEIRVIGHQEEPVQNCKQELNNLNIFFVSIPVEYRFLNNTNYFLNISFE